MRVLITPNGDGTWEDPRRDITGWKLYKFYVAGGVTNVQVLSVDAFDIGGNPTYDVSAEVRPY